MVLVSNFGDKNIIRKLVSYEISRIFEMEYTIDCDPIELMINGEYKGIYYLRSKIEISKDKRNIQKISKDDNSYPQIIRLYYIRNKWNFLFWLFIYSFKKGNSDLY